MYYHNFNELPPEQDQPIEAAFADTAMEAMLERKKKKSHTGAKIVSLCLVFALVGGLVGGAVGGNFFRGSTTVYEGSRTVAAVDVAQVTGQNPLTATQIYDAFVGSSVGITVETVTTNYFGQPVSAAAAGSGFVITQDGYIVTNYHVISGAESIKVAFFNGKSYDAELVGGEEENDVAVLKIDATGLTPVILGDSDKSKVGEQVFAIGNPLGELTFSLTGGYISAKDRNITMSDGTVMNMMQTDTAINSGNSGGPLFDSYGQVIGITSAKLSNSTSGGSGTASIEGLGFAIPMNDVITMIKDIMENGYVTGKAYMGITVTTIPASDAQQYGMSAGALVKSVDSSSCAATAGLKMGDIITGFADKTIASSAELIAAKKDYKAGDTVTLAVERSGEKLNLILTFDEDTPARRAAQEEANAKEEKEAAERLPQQQEQQSGEDFWPFSGGMNPWFY